MLNVRLKIKIMHNPDCFCSSLGKALRKKAQKVIGSFPEHKHRFEVSARCIDVK